MDIRLLLLRQASQEEIPIIQYIARTVYVPTYLATLGQAQVDYMLGKIYSTSAVLEQMQQGHSFLIAQSQGQDLGFVSYSYFDSDPRIFKLQKLYVLPEMQGSGIGAYMVKAVKAKVRKSGGKVLRLNINRFNQARDFYERQGFRIIEIVDIPIGEGYYMNDYVMEMDLEEGGS